MAFSLRIYESHCSLFCLLAIPILHSFSSQCSNLLVVGNPAVSGNETDQQALLDFKAMITHDPLGVMSSWNGTVHFCQWQGVTCGRRHRRVTVLDLQSLKLAGSISPHIGNLSFLRDINLQNNSFSHEIPPEVGRLRRLQKLDLSNNSFGGKIPANISGCFALNLIDIAFNKLVGEIPMELGSLLKLQVISIADNNLTGSIPSSFGNLSSLNTLSIPQNGLSGSIPDSLGNHRNIEWLALGVNRLSGTIPPSFFNFSSMKIFNVIYNQIEGSLPADLGVNLPHIQRFVIASNQITGSIPVYISNMSYVERLQMSLNKLTGNVPSLKNLNRLRTVGISNNNLGSGGANDLSFLCSLTNSSNLESLFINNNNLGGVLPECLGNFSTTFTDLQLGSNQMHGNIPFGIGNLINLEILDMGRNQFSGNIPLDIAKLLKLKILYLDENKFFGNFPSFLGNLKMLFELYLNDNNLQGVIPPSLGNCKNLAILSLSNNNISGSIPSEVIGLSSLSVVLDLSRNQLSGLLPMEVGNLKNLGMLDLSDNLLSGKIPNTIGSCVRLELLRMHENFFQGTIPSSLSSLRGVEELDLSSNNLSGQIPEFLAGFSSLRTLNLSFNDFEGVVPIKGVFKNASATSIKGNTKLCGGLPDFELPVCQLKNSKRRHLNSTLKIVISSVSGFLGIAFALSLLLICRLRKTRKKLTSTSFEDSLLTVSYQGLLKATEGFSSANLIGTGSFGSVYKGILDEGKTIIAVKVLNLLHRGADKSFIAECEALRNIRHRNLINLFTACSSIDHHGNDFKALVYEFMVNGSLEEWLHQTYKTNETQTQEAPKTLNLVQRLNIAIDVASALEYLHCHCHIPIVHCDLKPSNVLLNDEMVGHVGDFGLARFVQKAMNNETSSVGVRGSVGYTAPEYGMGSEVSTYGDVYSYGILLLEMFTGKRPTDVMFKDSFNLHNFVKGSLPQQVAYVTDPILIQEVEVQTSTNTHCKRSRRDNIILESLNSILGIGLSCSAEFACERMKINDVATELQLIRKKLLGTGYSGREVLVENSNQQVCKDIVMFRRWQSIDF